MAMAACPPATLSALLSSGVASSHWASTRLASLLAPVALFRAWSAGARTLQRRREGATSQFWVPRKATVPRSSNAEAVAPTATTISSNTSLPGSGCYEYDRLLPCPSQNRLPRVEHIVVSGGGYVLEYISKELNLPHLYVADLIHFGAVYYALVCPTPPPSATPEQIEIFKKVTAASVLQKRASIKGKTVREAQKTYRITHPNEFVEAGMYLRVHVHPKRFPRLVEQPITLKKAVQVLLPVL
uniref:RNA pseudourine synthase 6, chloroplastic n=1 Tax=Anthurium amnicola TaxID=1678845 RepID=A0A1D1YKR7_9ARAE